MTADNYDHTLDGGLCSTDDPDAGRVDVHVIENGRISEGTYSLELCFSTGCNVYSICQITPGDMIRMARFILERAREASRRLKKES